MLSKFISKGAQFHSAARANPKFPEGTIAGCLKASAVARPSYDCVRIDSSRINWTMKELDVSFKSPPNDVFACLEI